VRLETYGIATAPPDIRALFDRQMRPEGGWAWFEVLAATTLSDKEEAFILALVETGGRVLAAMPVVVVGGKVIRGLTSPFTTLFSLPLGRDEDARLFGKLLAGKIGASVRLDALDGADSATGALQEGLAAGGLIVLRFRHFANWFEHIQDFAGYWDKWGSQLKATVKRKAAPLQREDRLGFEWIDLAGRGEEAREIYNAIYAKSWKPAEPHPRFIDALLERLGPLGIARLAVARIDEVPAAAQIWLVQDQRATIFKLAHDPAFDRQSPAHPLGPWPAP
jgi:hypothetical protein